MRTRLTLAAALVTLVALGGSAALAARSNESTDDVRWISQETEFAVILPDGTRPDPKTLEGQKPQLGDQIFLTEDVFETKDGKTKGEKIGTDAITCILGAANHAHCNGTVFLEAGQLQFQTGFRLPDEGFEIDIPFTGGTGEFRDVGGEAHLSDISPENHEVTLTLWEVRLLHLGDGTGLGVPALEPGEN